MVVEVAVVAATAAKVEVVAEGKAAVVVVEAEGVAVTVAENLVSVLVSSVLAVK